MGIARAAPVWMPHMWNAGALSRAARQMQRSRQSSSSHAAIDKKSGMLIDVSAAWIGTPYQTGMARFFFHLHECGTVIDDEEGIELYDEAEMRHRALSAARAVMCAEITEGRLCMSCCIIVEDEQHREVMKMPFRDAVVVTGL